jgi:hypothetical protein
MTEIGRFGKDLKELLQEMPFFIVVLGQFVLLMSSVFHTFCTSTYDSEVSFPYIISGYISYNFVIGAYSYWGPKAGQQIYNMVEVLSFTHMWQYLAYYIYHILDV